LAVLLAQSGHPSEAVTHYRAALKLKSDWPPPLLGLAWLLATYPAAEFRRGNEAIQLAEKACELTQSTRAEAWDTLAASYAEAGQFPQAEQAAQKAFDLALATGDRKLADSIQHRLTLYRNRTPFRQ
jgi:Flp pilus assembly protein TadD